jgi:hypothetical protein
MPAGRFLVFASLVLLIATGLPGRAGAQGLRTPSGAYRGQLLVTAEPRNEADLGVIWDLAEDVLEPHDPGLTTHRMVVTAETVRRLRARQIPVRVESRDVPGWLDGLDGRPGQVGGAVPFQAGKLGIFGEFFTQVQNLEAINARLDQLAAASGGRAQVIVLGKSFQGRDIKAMRIASAPAPSARASIIVVGAQHAREWATPVVTMGLIEALITQYDADPRVRRVVDNLQIFINPVNNVDGYVATFNGQRLQRKNLNSACNVDLNRNYGTAWGMGTSGAGCNSGIYPGSGAFSEPESQVIRDLIGSLARPALFYDYHSTAAQVMIPYAYTTMAPPNLEKNRAWCELYSTELRALNGTNYPPRPGFNLGRGQGGGAFDWFRATFAETLVVELGGGFGFSIRNDQIIPFAEENYLAWLAVAQKVVDENPGDGNPGSDGGAPPPPPASDGEAPGTPTDAAAGPADGRPDPMPAPMTATGGRGGAAGGNGGASGSGGGAPAGNGGAGGGGAPGAVPPVSGGAAGGGGTTPGAGSGGAPQVASDIEDAGCHCALGRQASSPARFPLMVPAVALLALALRRRRARAAGTLTPALAPTGTATTGR